MTWVMMANTLWEEAVGDQGIAAHVVTQPAGGVSLRDLYRSQFEPMVRVATALLGERTAAEDVVQDAFVSVGRKLSSLNGSETAYLRRSVVNGCRAMIRRGHAAKRRPTMLVTEVLGADVAAAERAQHSRVLASLETLSYRQRQCLVLRYYAGLSDAEVANAVGIGIGSAKTHIRRGLEALRSELEDIR